MADSSAGRASARSPSHSSLMAWALAAASLATASSAATTYWGGRWEGEGVGRRHPFPMPAPRATLAIDTHLLLCLGLYSVLLDFFDKLGCLCRCLDQLGLQGLELLLHHRYLHAKSRTVVPHGSTHLALEEEFCFYLFLPVRQQTAVSPVQ